MVIRPQAIVIVTEDAWDADPVVGVYASRELAEDAIAAYQATTSAEPYLWRSFRVDEHEVRVDLTEPL